VRDWLVAADDRTGAFEVAALFAAVVGPVTVTVGETPNGSGVVDLGSRGLSTDDAAARAASVDAVPSTWTAHKIDSTMRGNWAAELLARCAVSGRRVVVLPGWPELGRTCVGGVVYVHGEAIGSVLEHLSGARLVADEDGLRAWLAGDGEVAVCDVPDTSSMVALASSVADAGVMIAGPAGPLGASFAAHLGRSNLSAVPTTEGPILVICGSANPVSREQIERLNRERPDIAIVSAPDAEGPLHAAVALDLADDARARVVRVQPMTIVVLGGDTAAAFLGDAPRTVGGLAAPGMPWSRDAQGGGPLVITKAGGFGRPDALVELLRGETG
jgi:uncharacterized protein YgbK (DUF1537 family)